MINDDAELTYQNIRRAAEVHRIVRQNARKHIRPGMTMTEIADLIEDGTRALVEEDGLVVFGAGLDEPEAVVEFPLCHECGRVSHDDLLKNHEMRLKG